jgi:hypothetical protein
VSLSKTRDVFGTTELIEIILSFLQPKEIISCRRLSTMIRNAIEGSSLLQELMFLQTTRVPQQSWRLGRKINGHGKGLTGIRPIVGLQSPPKGYFIPFQVSATLPRKTRTPAVLNPTFRPSPLFESRERDPDAYTAGTDCDHIMLSPNHPELKHSQIQDFKPNWTILDMYLTNPPCLEALLHFEALRLPRRYSRFSWSGFLQVATGITIRDLLNARSVIRGVGCLCRPEPSGDVAYGFCENVTLTQMYKDLLNEDKEDRLELYGDLRCDFLDTILPTDRMWAGVAPYAETDGKPKYSPETDHSWASSSDEEDHQDAEEDADSEDADSEEAEGEEAEGEEAEGEEVRGEEARGEEAEAKRRRARRRRAEKRSAKRRRAKKRSKK